MEFVEFVQLAAKFIVEEDAEAMQKELKEAFRLYDKAGNGFIPTTCLKEILRELDDQLTDHDLDGMIEEIDSDGSGTVDFDGKKYTRDWHTTWFLPFVSFFFSSHRIHGDDDRRISNAFKIDLFLLFIKLKYILRYE